MPGNSHASRQLSGIKVNCLNQHVLTLLPDCLFSWTRTLLSLLHYVRNELIRSFNIPDRKQKRVLWDTVSKMCHFLSVCVYLRGLMTYTCTCSSSLCTMRVPNHYTLRYICIVWPTELQILSHHTLTKVRKWSRSPTSEQLLLFSTAILKGGLQAEYNSKRLNWIDTDPQTSHSH